MSDFFLGTVQLSQRATPEVIDSYRQVLVRAQQAMKWLPNLQQEAFSLLNAGKFPRLNPSPSGLSGAQSQQWRMVYDRMRSIDGLVLKGEMKALAQEGARLERDLAFWNTVAKYSGTDIAEKLWSDFENAIHEFAAKRRAVDGTLTATQAMLNRLGPAAPPNLVGQQNLLNAKAATLSNKAKSTLSPLGTQAAQEAGLGLTWVVAGITAAGLIAITVIIRGITSDMAEVQMQANRHAQEVARYQEAYDREQLEKGNIDQAEFARRRSETNKHSIAVANAQGAGSIGSAFASIGTTAALVVGGVGLLAVIGYVIWKRRQAA